MSAEPTDFATLLGRFRAGSEEAARELCERFGPHLRRVIRRRLDARLRQQFDSMDLTQAVWASFLAAAQDRPFDDPAAFQAYLNRMAVHKVIDLFRRHLEAQKHDAGRLRSIDDSSTGAARAAAATDPTPSQAAIGREAWDRLLQKLSPMHQAILARLREGRSHREIADELKVSEKMIQRLLHRLQNGEVP
jgi:RNA polymerase sigma factor (sigma-70 family)